MDTKKQRNDRKFNKTREWLYNEYVVKDRSTIELAKECGLTRAGLKSALVKYNIRKPKLNISVSELKQYLDKGMTVKEISEKINCSWTLLYRIMKKNNLSITYVPDFSQYDDTKDKEICSLYLEGLTPDEIGIRVNLSRASVRNHLKHCGINLRSYVEAQFNSLGKEIPKDLKDPITVYNLYVIKKLSKEELGKRYNVDPGTIDRILRDFGIHVRNSSETKIGHKVGAEHPNWQGGITLLYSRLREAFQVQLVPKVKERDNNRCQICGSTEDLCVHHKIPFIDIVNEIIAEYPELDINKDVNAFYDIIVNDERFRDLNNLVTCCKHCHLYVIHGYKENKDK